MRIAYRHPLTLALAAALLISAAAAPVAGQPAVMESFRAQIALKSASGPRISPDGRLIAYSVTTTEWEANRFDREIWLVAAGGEPIQLTRTEAGSSTGHRWSPDGSRLGFLADRGDGEQIYLIPPGGGEAVRLTSHDGGIRSVPLFARRRPGSRSRPPTPLPTTSRGARKATATTPSKTPTSACPTSG